MSEDEIKLIEVEQRAKSNTHRIDKLEEVTSAIHEQNAHIARMVTELGYTNQHLDKLDKRISVMEKQPRDRINQIVTAIISALAGAVVTGVVGAVIIFVQ